MHSHCCAILYGVYLSPLDHMSWDPRSCPWSYSSWSYRMLVRHSVQRRCLWVPSSNTCVWLCLRMASVEYQLCLSCHYQYSSHCWAHLRCTSRCKLRWAPQCNLSLLYEQRVMNIVLNNHSVVLCGEVTLASPEKNKQINYIDMHASSFMGVQYTVFFCFSLALIMWIYTQVH